MACQTGFKKNMFPATIKPRLTPHPTTCLGAIFTPIIVHEEISFLLLPCPVVQSSTSFSQPLAGY